MFASVQGTLSIVLHSFFIKTREPFMCLCYTSLLQHKKVQDFLWVSAHSEGATQWWKIPMEEDLPMLYCYTTLCSPLNRHNFIDQIMVCTNILEKLIVNMIYTDNGTIQHSITRSDGTCTLCINRFHYV